MERFTEAWKRCLLYTSATLFAIFFYSRPAQDAAMSADGISRIHNIEQIDRGYQNIEAVSYTHLTDFQKLADYPAYGWR